MTRSQSQKPTHKDLEPKWPKPGHLGSRPLMFRFLSAPARAHKKSQRARINPSAYHFSNND
ncbi:hypothetical protein IJ11_0013500 [Lacticaseibacillus paracasei]|nr:hypothetical protein IJ11_0013500 [Lacticaseibacillus paracasei]